MSHSAGFAAGMKPQPAQAVAVFLLANQNRSAQAPTNVTIRFAELGLPPGVAMEVEDVSTGEKHAKLYTGELVTDVVGGHDSRFYLLSPAHGNL
jgi:hypothetical protein